MNRHKFFNLVFSLLVAASLLLGTSGAVTAKPPSPPGPDGNGQDQKITHADRQAAAARALQDGALNPLMVDAQAALAAAAAAPGDAPRYFSHPNYANSPLPSIEGAVIEVGNPLIDRHYASDLPSRAWANWLPSSW